MMPWTIALPLYLPVAALSVWLYVKIIESMRRPVATGSEGLLGHVAEVEPDGSLVVKGERWFIAQHDSVKPGQRVRIMGLSGLRLEVQPADPKRSE